MDVSSTEGFTPDDFTLYRCPRATCKGSSPNSGKSAQAACWSAVNLTSCDGDDLLCSDGAKGPLCGACDDGYLYSLTKRVCVECGSYGRPAIAFLAVLAFLLAFAVAYIEGLLPEGLELVIDWLLWTFFAPLQMVDSGTTRIIWSTLQIISSVS